jgi:hypothetical protein
MEADTNLKATCIDPGSDQAPVAPNHRPLKLPDDRVIGLLDHDWMVWMAGYIPARRPAWDLLYDLFTCAFITGSSFSFMKEVQEDGCG